MSDILIGTSGYDYPEWQGVFYPPELKRKDFLTFYSTQFNALELNSSFYSMPTAERMDSFMERTEGRVSFSVKANRLLTHEIDRNWQNAAEVFMGTLSTMNNKGLLSAVLFQFPQSFHYIPDNRYYLAHLIDFFKGFPVVIEFRHKEWIKESVFQGLVDRNASIVFCDMPDLKNLPAVSFENSVYSKIMGPQAYIRLHGRNEQNWYANDSSNNGSSRYDYGYSPEEIKAFVPVVHIIKNAGKKGQIFFNNHPKGNGAKNAAMLKEMLTLLMASV